MKRLLLIIIFFPLLAIPIQLFSQAVPCIYRLELKDEVGDGWNGAKLEVSINGDVVVYDFFDGDSLSFYINLFQDDLLEITYTNGDEDEESSYTLYNELEESVFSFLGATPEIFSSTISCSSCPVPPLSSISVDDILATSAIINWLAPDTLGEYLIELGVGGIQPGQGDSLIFQGGTTGMLTFSEKTAYTFYLTSLCANGDTSQVLGPFDFETCYSIDVGATDILAPFSDCGLESNETLITTLFNFGVEPQSLIPFAYQINGEAASIDMPRDGVYTGVIGKNEVDTAEFDARANFAEPGEYYVQVWTELEEDRDNENDTIGMTIYSIPTITELPYWADFETDFTGWTIGEDSENASWQLGIPTGGVINRAAEGEKAWVTNLNGAANTGELSYLLSPCMDFTNLTNDPLISFQLWNSTERDIDQFWMESTIDGGETWQRVENIDYDGEYFSFSGDEFNVDWARLSGQLTGLAGETDVRLRFVYFSDFANDFEGIGIDDVLIYEKGETDLQADMIQNFAEPACRPEGPLMAIFISNVGSTPVDSLGILYQVNGGPTQTATFQGASIDTNETRIISFTINADTFGVSNIVAWINTPADTNALNDTLRTQLVSSFPSPYSEDFETGAFPDDWIVRPDQSMVTNGHGNSSFVLAQNLNLTNPRATINMPFFGPVEITDTLSFEYRIVEMMGDQAKSLGPNDKIEISIANSCSADFTPILTIDQSNHIPRTAMTQRTIDLSAYVGQIVKFNIEMTWGGGNYWVDLDNFQIPRCDGELSFEVDTAQQLDGSVIASVIPMEGKGPYIYEWSTGETSSFITMMPDALFSVTVTDQFGCMGTFETLPVNTIEEELAQQINIYPNPTQDLAELALAFSNPRDVQIQVLNTMGQIIHQKSLKKITQLKENLDLSRQASGIYFVQVLSEGTLVSKKLIKSTPR